MKIYIIYVFLILSTKLLSQSQLQVSSNDPYLYCLIKYIDRLDSFDVINKGDTVFVSKKDYLPNYTGYLDNVYIQEVDNNYIYNKTKHNKTIGLIVINAAEFKNNMSTINVAGFSISRRNKKYLNINSGFIKVKYHYDCSSNGYKYEIIDEH